MNPQEQFCPNIECHASGKIGQGNIVIHSQVEKRYKCTCCQKTFSEWKGTAAYRLKKPVTQFVQVTTLLAHGCPRQAIVAAFGLDERTVASWQEKAGVHCRQVHEHMLQQESLDLQQVQADEIQVKSQNGTLWMAMALMVSTRLWLGGVVSERRDFDLIWTLMQQVRRSALCRPLLISVDGLVTYIKAIQRSFRSPIHTTKQGRPRLIAWTDVAITQVVKRRFKRGRKRYVSLEQRIKQGTDSMVQHLLVASQGSGSINTAYIERLNATFRQRLGSLARRSRALTRTAESLTAGMYLVGCIYNFCTWHKSLRLPLYIGHQGHRRWVQRTPAIAAGLTNHRWSVTELMLFKVPTVYQPPKRMGRPPKIICSCGFT
jgi:transposase-like protein/IS1 family transposase